MSPKCQITYRGGETVVVNVNGTPSKLYQDALSLVKDPKKALNIWASALTESFKEITGKVNENDNVSLTEVLKYYRNTDAETKRLSPSEKVELTQFMKANGFTKLSDLSNKLNKIFRGKGFVELNSAEALKDNFYTVEEIKNLDLVEIEGLLTSIDGELLAGDMTVEPQAIVDSYKNTNHTTILGTSETVSQETIDKEIEDIVNDFSSEKEFRAKVQELPYSTFVEKFNTNESFAKDVMSRFANLKKVPVLDIEAGKLTNRKTNTYSTVKNTVEAGIDSNKVRAESEYLASIPVEIWMDNQEEIQDILKEIEEEFVRSNIDLVGISEAYKNRDAVIELLDSLANMISNPTEENISEYAKKHDNLIKKEVYSEVAMIPESYQGLNIVKVYSSKTDAEMFEEFGLLKVGENLYHKIKRTDNTTDAYEFVYQEVIEDRLVIPSEMIIKDFKDILKKAEALKGIAAFVNSRNTGIESPLQEEISLYQLVFDHKTLVKTDNTKQIIGLGQIKTDTDYLKTDFISDFYNYILREKLKDSIIYRDILSKFTINDKDIILSGSVESIANLEYEQELSDYIRLSTNSDMKHLVTNEQDFLDEDLDMLNNPEKIPTYQGTSSLDSGYLIVAPNGNNWLKARGRIFRKSTVGENVDIYTQVEILPDNTYLKTRLDLPVNKELSEKILKLYDTKNVKEARKPYTETTFIGKIRERSRNFVNEIVTNFQFVSKGNELTEEDKTTLDVAKNLEKQGEAKEEIYKQTRWFKVNVNQWRREVGDVFFRNNIENQIQEIVNGLEKDGAYQLNLVDVVDTSQVEPNYTNIKNVRVIFKIIDNGAETITGWNGKDKISQRGAIVVEINTKKRSATELKEAFFSSVQQGRILGTDARGGQTGNGVRTIESGTNGATKGENKADTKRTLIELVNHEISHLLAFEAGTKVGNDPMAIFMYYVRKSIVDFKGKTNTQLNKELSEMFDTKDFYNDFAFAVYKNSVGERAAEQVEKRLFDKNITPDYFQGALDYDIRDFEQGSKSDFLGKSVLTEKNKVFETNLIEFIKNKGVTVVTDKEGFKKALEEAGIENFNIIGERGATQLGIVEENNFRSEALLEARKFEMLLGMSPNDWKKSNYRTEDKLKIKRATGWERNGEGAWLYEANNIEFKNVDNILDAMLSDKEIILNFEDVLAKGDVTNAYPNINNLKLKIYTNEDSTTNGYFNKKTGEIGINRRGFIKGFSEYYTGKISKESILDSTDNLRGLLRGTLSHEIAHFIQNEEGLQGGGNTLKLFIDLGLTTDDRLDKEKTTKYINEKIASIKSQISVIEDLAGGKTLDKIQKANKESEYRDLLAQLGKYGQWKENPTSDIVSRPYYESLVGEVGARNESIRFLMTPEERRNNLLEETEVIPRENQVNFLQTPAGNVLGFEKNGIIYLDEDQINDETTHHELLHVYQSMLEIKAKNGDKRAQEIIAKRQDLFQPFADGIIAYHKGKQRENNVAPSTLNFQIIGTKGAAQIDKAEEGTRRLDNLSIARKMEAQGKTPLEIRLTTEWERGADKKWRYEISDGVINPNFETRNSENTLFENTLKGTALKELYSNDELYTAFPNIGNTEVVFYNNESSWDKFEMFVLNNKIYVNEKEYRDGTNGNNWKKGLGTTLSHEIQHLIQVSEGFERGSTNNRFKRELLNIRESLRSGDKAGNKLSGGERDVREFLYRVFKGGNIAKILEDDSFLDYLAMRLYKMSAGEVEARNVEERFDKTTEERKKTLLSETQDVATEEQLILTNLINPDNEIQAKLLSQIGFDMSSPAYAKRQNESDLDYNTRVLKEVEAHMVAPETAKILEDLRKENPSLWEQITDYIKQLTDWLKGQIGLFEYKGDIMAMSMKEYSQALAVSSLKDDYNISEIEAIPNFNIAEVDAVFETRDGVAIGYNYNTDQVARERFDIPNLKKIGEGSDRVVFDLGDGKVLKVAKTARGLEQNIWEADGYLTQQGLSPDTYEVGLNYVVKEYLPNLKSTDVVKTFDQEGTEIGETSVKEMMKDLKEFNQTDIDKRTGAIQDVLFKYGLQGVMDYDILYGDFTRITNWGYSEKTNTPVHIDGGTFGGIRMLESYKGVKNLQDAEFREIYEKSRALKKEYQDKDKNTMFNIVGTKGAEQITELNTSLNKARELEKQGKTSFYIESQTGWYKESGDWKYFSKEMLNSFKFKEGFKIQEGAFNFTDVMQESDLIKAYPNLKNTKIIFYDGRKETNESKRTSFGSRLRGDIYVNLFRGYRQDDLAQQRAENKDDRRLFSYMSDTKFSNGILSTIMHETSHHIQQEEGFSVGGNIMTLLEKVKKYTNQSDENRVGFVRRELQKMISENKFNEEQLKEVNAVIKLTEEYPDFTNNQDVYKLLLGEVEARSLQYILANSGSIENKTYSELRREFEEVEGIIFKDKYDVRKEDKGLAISYQQERDFIKDAAGISDINLEIVSLQSESVQEKIFNKIDNCG